LVLATGGSGHAYKFLPVIGGVVADAIEGKLDPSLVKKFALDREYIPASTSRTGSAKALDIANLCSPDDLLPISMAQHDNTRLANEHEHEHTHG
ncbi:hypothetical protein FIBSPDRAFT_730595, partial [Athelia psychrophila]